jgi:hypothetical protein
LPLAFGGEAAVQGSIHKKLIFAGFGCAGVLVVLIVIALLFVPRSEFDQPRDQLYYTIAQASAARDSLEGFRVRFAAPRGRAADSTYGTFWKAALVVMRTEQPLAGVRALPYGDTFPAGSDARREWMRAADWRALDVLLVRAAGYGERPGLSDTVRLLTQVDANLIISITRALHARARRGLTPPLQMDEAMGAEREVIAIGRGLESEPDLAHDLVGARVFRDGLRFLATVPPLARRVVRDPVVALARADSDLYELRAVRRWMAAAGSLIDGLPTLESWARDTALVPAIRLEAVQAISYGWVFNNREPTYGLSAERGRILAALASLDLPPSVAAAVREGQHVQRLGVTQRFARSFEYRTARDAAAGF